MLVKRSPLNRIKGYAYARLHRVAADAAREVMAEHETWNEARMVDVVDRLERLTRAVDASRATLDRVRSTVRVLEENVAAARMAVVDLRNTPEYTSAFRSNPLVSIRIPTWNRSETLRDRAIASVLGQSYDHFEVLIVGDHCTDDTEAMIQGLRDARFKFINLPHQSIYPVDRIEKWQVIGALPMNVASSMASGDWIAPLDDDDEFTDDHLEVLVTAALEQRAEMVYGAMLQRDLIEGTMRRVWDPTPKLGCFSFNGAVYLRALNRIFQYDQYSWVHDEPADWNMCRRMLESGVRVIGIDRDVGILNMIPAGHPTKGY